MASFSLRMLVLFLIAAIMLNITNYWFIRLYRNQSSRDQYNYIYPKTVSGIGIRRSLNPLYWSSAAECEDNDSASTPNNETSKNGEAEISTYSAYYLKFEKTKTTVTKEKNCPEMPPGLGPELGDQSLIIKNLRHFDASSEVKPGGIYQPTSCKARESVAVIIAYRGSTSHLSPFMNILHPFLIKQQLDYQVFVVEQSNKSQPYNRGKLFNVGFVEATRYRKGGFSCIVFHEPHIVPMDSRNLYRCTWFPRQLATNVERPIKASYVPLLGGAIAMTPEQFLKVNGFSNTYWGNDADYYDLIRRLNTTNYFIENSLQQVGKYKTIRRGLGLWYKSQVLTTPTPLYLLDGLSSLQYNVDLMELRRLYTYLQVNINEVDEKSKTKK